jgi:hypothetical protein
MGTSTKKTTSNKSARFHRSQKPKAAAPTTKAGTVADAPPGQCPEFSQSERASPHPEPGVKRRGRKPKYRKEYARIAKAMCKYGATDYELAQEFEVATSTIDRGETVLGCQVRCSRS